VPNIAHSPFFLRNAPLSRNFDAAMLAAIGTTPSLATLSPSCAKQACFCADSHIAGALPKAERMKKTQNDYRLTE
jgi:hypothetical protein